MKTITIKELRADEKRKCSMEKCKSKAHWEKTVKGGKQGSIVVYCPDHSKWLGIA